MSAAASKASKIPKVDLVITAKDGAKDGLPRRLSPMFMRELEVLEEAKAKQKREQTEEKQVGQAVAAFNGARYEKALRLCDGIEGYYASMMRDLRAVCLGERARYTESEQAFAECFARDGDDPRVINAHAFFVAVNDPARAQPLYEKA